MSPQENSNPGSSSGSNSKDAMFEPKPKPKMIRVLTVLAYVLSVSMAAILLSIYYIFMWDGRPHLGARRSIPVEITNRSLEPKFSKYVSHDVVFNSSRQEYENNLTQTVPSPPADDLTVNGTRDNFYEEYSTTVKQENNAEFSRRRYIRELQQQITAIETEEAATSTTTPATTSEETSVTWPDDYEEFERSSILFKKIRFGYDY